MTVLYVVECKICRWQTNEFEQTDEEPCHDGVPLPVLLYFAKHIDSRHKEYRNNTVTGAYDKFGQKVRSREIGSPEDWEVRSRETGSLGDWADIILKNRNVKGKMVKRV